MNYYIHVFFRHSPLQRWRTLPVTGSKSDLRCHAEGVCHGSLESMSGIIKLPNWRESSKQQMYGNFGDFAELCIVWVGNIPTPVLIKVLGLWDIWYLQYQLVRRISSNTAKVLFGRNNDILEAMFRNEGTSRWMVSMLKMQRFSLQQTNTSTYSPSSTFSQNVDFVSLPSFVL